MFSENLVLGAVELVSSRLELAFLVSSVDLRVNIQYTHVILTNGYAFSMHVNFHPIYKIACQAR